MDCYFTFNSYKTVSGIHSKTVQQNLLFWPGYDNTTTYCAIIADHTYISTVESTHVFLHMNMHTLPRKHTGEFTHMHIHTFAR